ncbi:phage tail tube protein [Rhodococcus sp. RS1C4]|nr:hypothetical protein [Rhodococcus sp. RS1C4]
MVVATPPNSSGLETKLARDWVVRIADPLTTDTPDWIFVRGLSAVSPIFEGSAQETSDIDAGGYGSQTVTGLTWRVEGSGKRKGENASGFEDDPGQALLRSKGRQVGVYNFVRFHIYRRDDAPDSYQGMGPVVWTDAAASDPNALQEFSVTIHGNGAPVDVAKPTAAPPAGVGVFPFVFPLTL